MLIVWQIISTAAVDHTCVSVHCLRSQQFQNQQQGWSKCLNIRTLEPSLSQSHEIHLRCPCTPREHPAAANIRTYHFFFLHVGVMKPKKLPSQDEPSAPWSLITCRWFDVTRLCHALPALCISSTSTISRIFFFYAQRDCKSGITSIQARLFVCRCSSVCFIGLCGRMHFRNDLEAAWCLLGTSRNHRVTLTKNRGCRWTDGR